MNSPSQARRPGRYLDILIDTVDVSRRSPELRFVVKHRWIERPFTVRNPEQARFVANALAEFMSAPDMPLRVRRGALTGRWHRELADVPC